MKAFIVPTIFKAIDQVTAPLRNIGNGVQAFSARAEAGIARAERGFRRFTPGLGEMQKQFLSLAGTAAIVTAIFSGISFSFQAIKDYDKALSSLQAITGLSGDQFDTFKSKITEVAVSTNESTVTVAKAFEVIGSANSALLESADAMGAVTNAAIILSQASGDDLATSADSLVGVMNQFNLGADQATRTMNVLAAGAKVGAAQIPQVAESMKNFGSVAHGANISVEQSVALVELLSQFGYKGAEAGTKLRGSILKLQSAGVGYASGQFNVNDALSDTSKLMAKLKTDKEKDAFVTKMFGAENVATGKLLLSNTKMFADFTKGVEEGTKGQGDAVIQAGKQNESLSRAIDQLSNAWVTMLTSSKKTTAGLDLMKTAVRFLTKNLTAVVATAGAIIAFFVTWKALIITSKVALLTYNIALGIYNGITGRAAVYTAGQTAAMKAQLIVTKLVTAAQWAFNVAMTANPIGLIVVGVAALIGLLAVAVKNWDSWGAALAFFLGPLGLIVSLFQAFRSNWDMIVSAFKTDGIIGGLKAIGKTILDVVLLPLQQLLALIAKIPGMDWAKGAAESVQGFRENLGVNTGSTASEENKIKAINPQLQKQESMQRIMETQKQNVAIDIRDKTGRAEVSSDNNIAEVKLSSTYSYGKN